MQAHMLRRITIVMAMVLVFSLTMASLSNAQEGPRQLAPGAPVTGTLSADNFAESYVFAASAGDTITLRATTAAEDLSLALLLTDPDGNTTSASGDEAAIISNVTLTLDGSYVVTVLRASGVDGTDEGEYTLSLAGEITAPGSGSATDNTDDTSPVVFDGNNTYISLQNGGVDFQLDWFAAVDLNLEIRDPVGGALFFDNLNVDSGGVHGGNANNLCEDATATPTETASWAAGFVPAGSYEVIIYYENGCNTGGPQTFELSASVDNSDGNDAITGVLNPGQRYLARVEIDINGNWELFNGGVDAGQLDLSRVADPVESALGQAYTGSITNVNPKDAYIFDGVGGQSVEFAMTATTGSLDTLLILLGPSGARVADNDDFEAGNTNSFIATTLPSDGEYTLLATRYGQVIGGTEGNYTLTLSTVSEVVGTNGDTDTTDTTDTTTTTTTVTSAPQGSIEISLTWATQADLQLLVRDPSGASVYDDFPTIASGGILDADRVGNQGCVSPTTAPESYIYWPVNRTPPSGAYEVEVWYQNDCSDARPVTFDLRIEINGQLLGAPGATSTVTTTATTTGNRYMISFTYDEDSGTVALGDGGFFDMSTPNSLDYAAQLGTAQELTIDVPINGRIDLNQRFVVYRFEGRTGNRLSIQMTAQPGSTLDTALFLLDPNGVPLASNDDILPGENTNSQISEIALEFDGTYFIIATHYGLQYGVTTGDFQLSVLGFN